MAEFNKLHQRFSLLHILEQNFSALNLFLRRLCEDSSFNSYKAHSEANRHLMNYLSSGYALREHLEKAVKRDFGRKSKELFRFEGFIEYLERTSFEYAFLQDFRDYVQHCGFPVGEMQLTSDKHGKILTLTYSKTALLTDYKTRGKDAWSKSNLPNRHETEFDLIALVKKHHLVAMAEFSIIIQDFYVENLNRIEEILSGYDAEAKNIEPNAIAKIAMSVPPNPSNGRITFRDIPRNPFDLLGIFRKRISRNVVVLNYQLIEHDNYYDVRKCEVMGFHPEMTNLDYDPFPEAKNGDVVLRALMSRDLLLYAKLEAPVSLDLNLSTCLELDGHRFFIDKISMRINTDSDQALFDVEGSERKIYREPIKILAEFRKELAEKRS